MTEGSLFGSTYFGGTYSAPSSSSSGIDPFIDGAPNIKVFINSIDVTDYIIMGSLSINDTITTKVNTCSCQTYDVAGLFIPTVSDQIQVYDIYSNLIFAGIIVQCDQERFGINPTTGTELIQYDIACQDYTRLLTRRLVVETFDNAYAGDIVTSIIGKYFALESIDTTNVEQGPLVTQITFNYETADKCFEDLATVVGFQWFLDYTKGLHFFDSSTPTSVVTFTDSTINWTDLIIKPDTSQLRNRIYVRGGIYYSSPYTQSVLADGVEATFALAYTPNTDGFSVSISGTPYLVGIKNVDDTTPVAAADWDFLLDAKEKTLSMGGSVWATANTPIAASTQVDITYNYQIPVLTVQEDSDSIMNIKALEGGSGIYEDVIIDQNISSLQDARARASAALRDYANPIVQGSITSYDVYGIRAGNLISINSARRGLNADYLVQTVVITQLTHNRLQFDISFSGRVYAFLDVLISLFKQRQNVVLGINEVLDALNTFSDRFTLSDTAPVITRFPIPFAWSNDLGTTTNKARWSLSEWV